VLSVDAAEARQQILAAAENVIAPRRLENHDG
jgi:hypothetical protein